MVKQMAGSVSGLVPVHLEGESTTQSATLRPSGETRNKRKRRKEEKLTLSPVSRTASTAK